MSNEEEKNKDSNEEIIERGRNKMSGKRGANLDENINEFNSEEVPCSKCGRMVPLDSIGK